MKKAFAALGARPYRFHDREKAGLNEARALALLESFDPAAYGKL